MMTETLEERKKKALEDLRVATAHCIEFESAKEDLVSWYEEHQKLIRELLAPSVPIADGEVDEAIKVIQALFDHKDKMPKAPYKPQDHNKWMFERSSLLGELWMKLIWHEGKLGYALIRAAQDAAYLRTLINVEKSGEALADERYKAYVQGVEDVQQPRQEWKTMDTWSNENESIVLVTNGKGTWPAQWHDGADGDGFYEVGTRYGRINGCTHWLPLPSPPKDKP